MGAKNKWRFLSRWQVITPSSIPVFVAIASVFALNVETQAQIIDFDQNRAFLIEAVRKVYFSDGTPVVGTDFVAQLYYGASADSLTPVLAPSRSLRNVPQTDSLAGTWFGTTRTLTGFLPGDFVFLDVRVWDSTVASTYEQAVAMNFLGTQHGISATFTYRIPPLGGDPNSYMENFRSFTLVPEPSVIGLVSLDLRVFGFSKGVSL